MTLISLLKVLHLLASTLFVGNVLVSFFWNVGAARDGEPRVLAFASELVTATDRWLLTPAVFALVITGNAIAALAKVPVWTTPRLASAVALFVLSGVVWAAFLVPLQKRQLKLAGALRTGEPAPPEVSVLGRRWMCWAPVAIALGVAAQVLMIVA